MSRLFGTDGIRGIVGSSVIRSESFFKIGWAFGQYFSRNGVPPHCLIARDTRSSGALLESNLESGLRCAGASVQRLGVMPTPALAYLTRSTEATAGLMITASHNPFTANGLKIFCSDGGKLTQAVEDQIEQIILSCDLRQLSYQVNFNQRPEICQAEASYIAFCKRTAPALNLSGWRIVLDCANGAAYSIAPRLLSAFGAEVVTINAAPNGSNINLDAGTNVPAVMQQQVLHHQADIGIAFDGDADRILMADHLGQIVDGDALLYILALHYKRLGQLAGVVGTVMSNTALERVFHQQQIPFERVAVGDRNITQRLKQKAWTLGGEPSGHIICPGTTTSDALATAVHILSVLVSTQSTLQSILKDFHKLPQCTLSVRVHRDHAVLEEQAVQSVMTEVQSALSGSGRLIVRLSGTEPVVRMTVEAESSDEVEQALVRLVGAVQLSVRQFSEHV